MLLIFQEEETQITGIVFIVDFNGMGWTHLKNLSPSILKKDVDSLQVTAKYHPVLFLKQNRESTEGYSNSIVCKNNDKFGKMIGLNK